MFPMSIRNIIYVYILHGCIASLMVEKKVIRCPCVCVLVYTIYIYLIFYFSCVHVTHAHALRLSHCDVFRRLLMISAGRVT